MEITINNHGIVTEIKDAVFVVNAHGWGDSNKIKINYDAVDQYVVDYAKISFRREDGASIRDLLCEKKTDSETGLFYWEYCITENDGVLACDGNLDLSVQFIHDVTLGGVVVSKEVCAGFTVSARVLNNIGISNQTEYNSVTETVNNAITPYLRILSRNSNGETIRLNGTALTRGDDGYLDINAVPVRLSGVASADFGTKVQRQNARLYVDNNGVNGKVTMQAIKELGTKIVSVDSVSDITESVLNQVDENDYIYVKEN